MEGEKVRAGQSFNTNTSILDIHILVVDDDATSLAIVSAMLRTLKYGVVTVRNPLDALATLRVRKFDLVVTDLHMPVMNGFELQKRVEEEFKLPVIMMSADDEASVILKSLESGAAFYIVKPVSPNDLKHVWQYAVPAKKGKSVVIEELGSLRGDSSGEKVSYEDRNSASSSVNEEKRSKKDSKRKQAPKKAKKDGEEDNLVATKKAKVVWTTALHNRFLQALRHMGLEKAVPKRILEFMNVPGITRENVASHLQKYRIFLKRIADKGASLSKGLSDRSLRSSFASGLPLLMFQNAQQEYLQFSEQQQMKTSIFQQGGGGNNMALNAPTLGPSLFSNRTTSSGSSLPQFGYGQSLIASNFGPVRFPDKEASSSNFVPQLGHGRWHALSDQANLHQPLFGNRSPFYQANRPAFATEPNNLGSNFPSHGDTRHGLMNATNGLMNGTSSIHIYPEQTEPRPELLINPPLNYNFGTSGIRNPDYISGTEKLGSLNSSNPVNPNSSYTNGAYAGIKMSNGGDLVVTGSIGDGYGLNDNMTVAPMGNGTSRYMTQEGFSSAGFECANQLPPVFNTVNQHENTLLMPSQAQQGLVNGGENQFGSDDHILNDIYNFSEVSHVIREDDLGDLFMEQNYNQPPSQYEPEANPPLNELQNPDLSGSSCGEENPPWREPSSFGQHRAGEQLVDAVFEGNMYPPEVNPDQHPNRQENDKELGDLDDLYCMYQAENTPSESHPFLNQEWEDEFMDSLFGLGPYLRE